MLLDDARQQPSETDAVRAHVRRPLGPVLVLERHAEGIAVLGPELEDVAVLDAASNGERGSATRARIAGFDRGDLDNLVVAIVATRHRVLEVLVDAIGADDERTTAEDG